MVIARKSETHPQDTWMGATVLGLVREVAVAVGQGQVQVSAAALTSPASFVLFLLEPIGI